VTSNPKSPSTDIAGLQFYRTSGARHEPEKWAEGAPPVGTFDYSNRLMSVECFERERVNNAGLEITQVPRDLTTVAWFWQCDHGHRWREPMYSVMDRPASFRDNTPMWKKVYGCRGAACRTCTILQYGVVYTRCGHTNSTIYEVSRREPTIEGWCDACLEFGVSPSTGPGPRPGEAFHSAHQPPTSAEERGMRALLAGRLPICSPLEANAVAILGVSSLGARHVFPDFLVPSRRVAIEYDSPGREGDAHGEDSFDAEKDVLLRQVGWEVIRIRTGGLPLTDKFQVAATGPTAKAAYAVTRLYNEVLSGRPED
jgi:hypothetical protein